MRGLETATAIAAQSEIRFTVWKETYEYRTKGLYIGPSLAKLKSDYPLADFEPDMEIDGWVCGGVETPEDVIARAKRIVRRLYDEFSATDKVVLVSHGGFNSVLLGVLLGCVEPHQVKFGQANCCINALRITTDRVHVAALNRTDHLSMTDLARGQQGTGVPA
jgi:broad specificity phosphatase PhoE